MIQLLSLPHPRDLQPVQYIMIMAHSQHHALDRSDQKPAKPRINVFPNESD